MEVIIIIIIIIIMCNNNIRKPNKSSFYRTYVSNLPRHVVCKTCFRSAGEVTNFMFTTASGPILGLSQPPMRSLPGAVSTSVKWREREADDSLPYNSNIRKAWSYFPYISLTVCLSFHGQYRKVCSP